MRTRVQGRAEALPMIGVAMTMRLYRGLSLEFTAPQNAAWLCPLLGLSLYLPFAFALREMARLGDSSPWENLRAHTPEMWMRAAAVAFALVLLWDAAKGAALTALSSNILALDDVSPRLLLLPLALMVLLAVKMGAPALGDSARLWLHILPLFALIILLVQLGNYKLGWLTPILGGGVASLMGGCVYCAGCMALLSLPWLLAIPDVRQGGLLPCAIASSVAASAVLLSQQLLLPAMLKTNFTLAARIDLILNNGRMTLSPQIIMDVLWFGNMLHLICAEAVTAAEFLRTLSPKLSPWLLGGVCALAVVLLCANNGAWTRIDGGLARSLFAILGATLAALMGLGVFRKGGERG